MRMALHTENMKAFGDFFGPFQGDLMAALTGIEKGGVCNMSLGVSQIAWRKVYRMDVMCVPFHMAELTDISHTTISTHACMCAARRLSFGESLLCGGR